ncbi:MAG: hypothetical protein GY898_06780 [Proteobacteria bacterium]|nr:hypothetical protein [Pseudomonadota bacterium]
MIDLAHLGLGPLFLVHGALEDQSADAIVTEANSHLQMTGGIAGFIRKKGGMVIHQEAIAQGPLPVGRLVRTGAGELEAERVYHAILIDYFVGKGMSSKVIVTLMGDILTFAVEDVVRSIALPLFGSDGGLGLKVALEAIIEGLEAAGREGDDEGIELRFVVRDPEAYEQACAIAQELKAGDDRRDEESTLASNYLDELMAEMGGDFDLTDLS